MSRMRTAPWDMPESSSSDEMTNEANRTESSHRPAFDAAVREAIRRGQEGDTSLAVEQLERLVAERPSHPIAQLHLALLFADAGRYEEAVRHADIALELEPRRPAFLVFGGRALFDAGHYADARCAFDKARELSPENDLAHAYRILVDWAEGNRDAAGMFEPDSLPDSNAFLARLLCLIERDMRGRHTEYVAEGASAPLLDRIRIGYILWRGERMRRRGAFLEALAVTDPAMEIVPGAPRAVAFQRACREDARRTLTGRVEKNPDDAETRIELACLLADMDAYEEADRAVRALDAQRAEEQADDLTADPQIARLRARIAYGLGDVEEALRQSEEGREPGFSMAETWYVCGLCHLERGARHEAVTAFEKLVAKVCWAVPLRLREYLAWRRSSGRPAPPSASETSPSDIE